MLSTFGFLTGMMLTTPRTLFAMASDGFLPRAVARVHPERVAGLEVVRNHLSMKLDPGLALTDQALHPEAGAPEDAGAEFLLETDGQLDAFGRAQEAVALDHQLAAGLHLHRQDLAGHLRRERDGAAAGLRTELRHEDPAARDRMKARIGAVKSLIAPGKDLLQTASDAPGNPPAEALTTRLEGSPFWIDNTPPKVTALAACSAA